MPQPVREFTFHKYRFDFAWPALKIAVEIDGGTYMKGAHVIGKGYERDCKKNNLAQLEGWVVLRADRNMVSTEEFARTVQKMICTRIRLRNEWKRLKQSDPRRRGPHVSNKPYKAKNKRKRI